ncbi:MAG: aconitate hydratase [Desulfobacteraceae bacterium]|nr:aconitate hydratase [Desulfobacteraceae bacterium]
MNYIFDRVKAETILSNKRKLLGRGLTYTEKILFLHEIPSTAETIPTPGIDQIRLFPARVAMQDATAQMAMLQFIQTGQEKTHVPATIHCDHLIRASQGSEYDIREALLLNREVYDFLSSAASKYGIGFWGPGSGIIHQLIFENYALPGGIIIGTDSHTPNAGGLGMIAIGVGGADAAEVMAGLPWETTLPFVVGVRLKGSLKGWASAKDVAFEILDRFGVKGGTGKIFEYFGEGARTLSATQKATITNMGAEIGATASVFVYDETMDVYLRGAGRVEDAKRALAIADMLSQDDICITDPEEAYDQFVELDLDSVKPAHAGPFSPDRITKVRDFRWFISTQGLPRKVSAVLLGSCTNSSYSDLYAAAQIVEQAAQHGCGAKVPFMLSPGSQQIYETIKRDGILSKLVDAGAVILSASCGPCIGQWERQDVKTGEPNSLFTTFNRNFRGRNDANPETRSFLTSPAMAAALAFSGDAGFNPETDALVGIDGREFMLSPPDPPAFSENGLVISKEAYIPPGQEGEGVEIKIDPDSERLELLRPFEPWDGEDFVDLPILVKTRGKTTTDHISPGGEWLRFRGHLTNISQNLLADATNAFTGETGHGTNVFTGASGIRFSELAQFYKKKCGGFVIVGDENYGEGSSREHAAMSPRFLGAKVVVARSFARIHEANLKKQGILPLTFLDPSDYDRVGEYDTMSFVDLNALRPGNSVKAIIKGKGGSSFEALLGHTLTEEQMEWFRAGSALNSVRRQGPNSC